jgi:hypothetical protein
VTIADSDGNEIASFTATKEFGNVVYSSSSITTGSSYTVTVNGTATTVTAGEGGQQGMGGGGMGAQGDQSGQSDTTTTQ